MTRLMPKRLPSEEFNRIYSKVPRLCVDIVVKSSEGILLTKRAIPPSIGYWHIPGGTIMHGETLEQAVKRVAEKELGVDVKIIKILGATEFLSDKTTIMGHAVSIPHLVKVISGKIKLDNQASEYRFFKKIPGKTIPEHKKFLESYK